MSGRFKRITIVTAVAGAGMLLLGYGFAAAGARINTSKSIPVGLYWTSSTPVGKGSYVQFCPPRAAVFNEALRREYIDAGFCPGNYGYLFKRVSAASGDVVAVDDDGVRVNGVMLPMSKPVSADKSNRPLPRFQTSHYTLGQTQFLLMSDVSKSSFDSRYYGPIDQSQIASVIVPVLTW